MNFLKRIIGGSSAGREVAEATGVDPKNLASLRASATRLRQRLDTYAEAACAMGKAHRELAEELRSFYSACHPRLNDVNRLCAVTRRLEQSTEGAYATRSEKNSDGEQKQKQKPAPPTPSTKETASLSVKPLKAVFQRYNAAADSLTKRMDRIRQGHSVVSKIKTRLVKLQEIRLRRLEKHGKDLNKKEMDELTALQEKLRSCSDSLDRSVAGMQSDKRLVVGDGRFQLFDKFLYGVMELAVQHGETHRTVCSQLQPLYTRYKQGGSGGRAPPTPKGPPPPSSTSAITTQGPSEQRDSSGGWDETAPDETSSSALQDWRPTLDENGELVLPDEVEIEGGDEDVDISLLLGPDFQDEVLAFLQEEGEEYGYEVVETDDDEAEGEEGEGLREAGPLDENKQEQKDDSTHGGGGSGEDGAPPAGGVTETTTSPPSATPLARSTDTDAAPTAAPAEPPTPDQLVSSIISGGADLTSLLASPVLQPPASQQLDMPIAAPPPAMEPEEATDSSSEDEHEESSSDDATLNSELAE